MISNSQNLSLCPNECGTVWTYRDYIKIRAFWADSLLKTFHVIINVYRLCIDLSPDVCSSCAQSSSGSKRRDWKKNNLHFNPEVTTSDISQG